MSFGGGSGGSSKIATAQDVALNNPADGQVLEYNGTLAKWQNQNAATTVAVENVDTTSIGSTYTIPNVTTATIHNVTLTAASCTVTMPTATPGASFTLVVQQDATGGRAITWPAGVKWPGGTQPTLTSAASAIDCLTFLCVQTYWLGFLAGNNMQ